LCLLLAPTGVEEVRIDVVSDAGFQDTLIAKPNEDGCELFDVMGPEESDRMMMCNVSYNLKEEPVFHFAWGKQNDLVDLTDVSKELKPLSEKAQQRVVHNDRPIRINQSGDVIFVHVTGTTETYVVH